MKTEGETRNLLHNFIILVKNQFNRNIKTFRTFNGKEFDCNELYEKYGILHQRTCVETPQQNVVAKRKHQHIMNVTCILLFNQVCQKSTGLMLLAMLFI